MIINVRFMCVDVPIGLGNGEISIEEGATIEDVVRYCAKLYSIELSISELLKSLFLVNSQPALIDYVLSEGDNLSIVRPLAGG